MKIFIILTAIGLYLALGILTVAIFNKYENESIEETNPDACILFIMLWPAVLVFYLCHWFAILPLRLCTILTNIITKKEEDEK